MKATTLTGKALLASVLSLTLCFAMLLGTTFAWFTDKVTTGANQIISGDLEVALLDKDGKSLENATDLFRDKNGNADILWEPNATFKTVDMFVENKGNLALKYKLILNITGEDAAKLLEVVTVTVTMGGETVDIADFEGKLMPGYQSEAIVITTHMDQNADEKYENLKAALSLTVLATQLDAEFDSFGNDYDVDAPASVWDGTVPATMPKTLVVDGDTQTVHVKDAAAFAYLSALSATWADLYTDGNGRTHTNYANGAGTNYYYSGQWTVSLEADIDLKNHPIDPVVLVLGESTGFSAFQGNGHVIRNINTTAGLFADNNRVSYSDLTLVNVTAVGGALTATSNTSIKNVTVKNATVTGTDYVGGLVGYIYGDVIGCKVIGGSVIASGKEAGGLIGFIDTSSTGTVTHNTVRGVSVFANNRAAGLVAQANVNVFVHHNTVDTVTVGAEDLSKYAPDAVISNAIVPENVYDNTVVNAEVLGAIKMVGSSSDLSSAIAAGSSAVLTDDVQYGSKIQNDVSIDLAGNTFEATGSYELGNNADLTMKGGDYVVNGTYGHVDVRPSDAEGSVVVFEDVDFSFNQKGKTYGPSTNRLGSVVEVCATVADAKTVIVFRNCTFDNAQILFEGMSGKTGEFEATFENCTFNALTSSAPIEVQNYVKGTITVKNCTFNLTCTSSTASAISISPSTSTSVTLNAENNVLNAVAATPYTYDASLGETEVDNVKVNGTPANIKFVSAYENSTVNVTGTTVSGIAVAN